MACLACGAAISIGDQLHPSGRMNESTYRMIGKAYELVEQKEPYCIGARNLSDIAVLSCEAALGGVRDGLGTDSNTGTNRILLEGKHLFDFVDRDADFTGYKLMILPDRILLNNEMATRLKKYLQDGGKLLLTGSSGLNEDQMDFQLDVGARYAGQSKFRPDYMVPAFETVNGRTEYVMYSQGLLLSDVAGEVFAYRQAPYFNRTGFHFSSHQHTPNDIDAPLEPAAVYNQNIAYIGWNVFEDYAPKGELIVKELVLKAIDLLLGDERMIRTSLPDRGVVTVTRQENRHVVHLLFAHTTVRGKGIEVIEDTIDLHDVRVSLKQEKKPSRVYLAPQDTELSFTWDGNRVCITIPQVTLHQMIVVEE